MNLDWKDCKYRSIADSLCGTWTASVTRCGQDEWEAWLLSNDRGRCLPERGSREAAKAAAEKWLDDQDVPEWHIAKSGLASIAEWRGWTMICFGDPGHVWRLAMRSGFSDLSGGMNDQSYLLTLGEAQAAIEAEVRRWEALR